MSSEDTSALATTAPSDATPTERDLSLVPSLDTENRPMFPVSMVVHGGTGILHGNMTSLTVNQYIGVVPDRDAWDSGKVRELMADAVKVSADANIQLFHPEALTSSPTSGYQSIVLSKKIKKNGWWLVMVGLVLVCVVPLGTVALFVKFVSPTTSINTSSTEENSSDESIGNNSLRILPRSYWAAAPVRGVLPRNTLPIYLVVVVSTFTDECFTSSECVNIVHRKQIFDFQSLYEQDIVYNFLIGGDGNVYAGRGWDIMGDHTKAYNRGSVGIALIGSFTSSLPNDVQVKAFDWLVETGVESHKISADYSLVHTCQLRTDGYRNQALVTYMMSWPHFNHSFPISRCKDD